MKSFVQIAPTDFEQQHHLAREKPAGILYSTALHCTDLAVARRRML